MGDKGVTDKLGAVGKTMEIIDASNFVKFNKTNGDKSSL